MSKIYNIYGTDTHAMTMKLLQASSAISLVPPGGSIALKPNLVLAGTPDNGAVTHPGVLSGCIEYFREHGANDLSIIESSWAGADTLRAMKIAGYDEICKRYNVPFYDLKRDNVRSIDTPIGKIEICSRALDAGLLVNLPVLKGHCQTVMTCALKNLKGCIPDREKRRFHSLGLTKPIAALGSVLRAGLIIVDSICGDLHFEEGGSPVQTNRMYLGTEQTAIDAYGCELMGLELSRVPYVKLAHDFGAGGLTYELEDLNEPEKTGHYPRLSGVISGLVRNVHENSACSACYASLVRALYTSRKGTSRSIYIGQGWRGKRIPGGALGIGRCCEDSGAGDCVKGCPPSAKDITEKL